MHAESRRSVDMYQMVRTCRKRIKAVSGILRMKKVNMYMGKLLKIDELYDEWVQIEAISRHAIGLSEGQLCSQAKANNSSSRTYQ